MIKAEYNTTQHNTTQYDSAQHVQIIMYHYVRNLTQSRYPEIKGLDLKLFRTQIKFLQKNFSIISADDLILALNGGTKLPKNSVLLTFDDGYIDHYTNVLPILTEESIPAFFSMPAKIIAEQKVLDVNKIHFILAQQSIEKLIPKVYRQLQKYRTEGWQIPPDKELYKKLAEANRYDSADIVFVKRLLQVELDEKLRNMIVDNLFKEITPIDESAFAQELYMSYDQVKFMSKQDGITFGFHGYDHYWMNRLTPEELRNDITKALDVFDGIIDRKNWICCYPYGSYSDEVISCAKSYGAAAGLGTDVNIACINEESRYILPRLDTNDFPPKSDNYKNLLCSDNSSDYLQILKK